MTVKTTCMLCGLEKGLETGKQHSPEACAAHIFLTVGMNAHLLAIYIRAAQSFRHEHANAVVRILRKDRPNIAGSENFEEEVAREQIASAAAPQAVADKHSTATAEPPPASPMTARIHMAVTTALGPTIYVVRVMRKISGREVPYYLRLLMPGHHLMCVPNKRLATRFDSRTWALTLAAGIKGAKVRPLVTASERKARQAVLANAHFTVRSTWTADGQSNQPAAAPE